MVSLAAILTPHVLGGLLLLAVWIIDRFWKD